MENLGYLIETQAGLVVAFLVTALIVVLAGTRLSLYGDALGERTGLGSGLVGLIFLAAVTSLPELVVSLTAVIQCANPHQGADLAIGNMLGSNVFNLLILALMALLFPRRFTPEKLTDSHSASILYGLIMLGLFAIAFQGAGLDQARIPGLQCSWATLLLPIAYGSILFRERRRQTKVAEHEESRLPSEQKLSQCPAPRFYCVLCGLCLLIIGGGIVLSVLGSRMALPSEQGGFGLEASLIGTLFLAISTSLPELVISIASVRRGFLDMAVGNVLGSNMFNLLIVFAADVAMRSGNLLHQASPKHWVSVGLILLLTLLAGGLLRTRTRWVTTTLAGIMMVAYLAALVGLV